MLPKAPVTRSRDVFVLLVWFLVVVAVVVQVYVIEWPAPSRRICVVAERGAASSHTGVWGKRLPGRPQ